MKEKIILPLILSAALAGCGSENATRGSTRGVPIRAACTEPGTMPAHARDALRAVADVRRNGGTLGDLKILTEQCSDAELEIAVAFAEGSPEGNAISEIRNERN